MQTAELWAVASRDANRNSALHGFWGPGQTDRAIKLALIHSELSEAWEVCDWPAMPAKKIFPLPHLAEEIADAMIRVMDYVGRWFTDAQLIVMFALASELVGQIEFTRSAGWGRAQPKAADAHRRIGAMHYCISQVLESVRCAETENADYPPLDSETVWLARFVAQCQEFAGTNRFSLHEAVTRKMAYNATRPPMHGGRKF